MLHADVVPVQENWLDMMLVLMEHLKVDVLSVTQAIKGTADCSVALDEEERPRRLPLADCQGTLTSADHEHSLLINTGLMLVDLKADWIEDFPGFTIDDWIEESESGEFIPRVMPEDWNFSRWMNDREIPFATTSLVECQHIGPFGYSNQTT